LLFKNPKFLFSIKDVEINSKALLKAKSIEATEKFSMTDIKGMGRWQ